MHNDYRFLKALNPSFPFLVREAKIDTSPYMIARFGASFLLACRPAAFLPAAGSLPRLGPRQACAISQRHGHRCSVTGTALAPHMSH